MNKHRVTAIKYNKPTRPPFTPQIIGQVDEEFLSIFNAQRRVNDLEYLDYEEIKLIPADQSTRA